MFFLSITRMGFDTKSIKSSVVGGVYVSDSSMTYVSFFCAMMDSKLYVWNLGTCMSSLLREEEG